MGVIHNPPSEFTTLESSTTRIVPAVFPKLVKYFNLAVRVSMPSFCQKFCGAAAVDWKIKREHRDYGMHFTCILHVFHVVVDDDDAKVASQRASMKACWDEIVSWDGAISGALITITI